MADANTRSLVSIVLRIVIGAVLIGVHLSSGNYAFAVIGALSVLSAVVSLIRRHHRSTEQTERNPNDRT